LDLANFLYKNGASVITKIDSLNPKTQDILAGVSGASEKIMIALENLRTVGFMKPTTPLRAGASMVVTKLNLDDAPDVWRYCRKNNLFPNLEMLIPNGRAEVNGCLAPTQEDYSRLKQRLLQQDREEHGYTWLPSTPLPGAGCFQCMYNVYIDVEGWARPCSSIHAKVANVRQMPLSTVIKTPFFHRSRNIEKFLTGKCASCAHSNVCVGCRGLAYTTAKQRGLSDSDAISSSDPSCWI
jgi:radical SAM protein with 4Fe4S-binding SPASM domain